jgi:GTPase
MEYKRQLHDCAPSRLEKLRTQMSYRLDEGHGCCVYRIGVEDNGCHSLMDYDACAETARVLEVLARSLNAVVLERKMIQNEIYMCPKEGGTVKQYNRVEERDVLVVMEPSLLGDGKDQFYDDHHRDLEPIREGNATNSAVTLSTSGGVELDKSVGTYTRCELTIQRVETHLLDPSPISLETLSNHAEAKRQVAASKASASKNGGNGATKTKGSEDVLSVAETLSSRNVRVAVVGNVDAGKSTMIGTLTSSCLDDGRGSSRTSIMKHRHEIESGRTSTASTHLMGFRSTGEAIAGKDSVRANRRKSEDEVARESYRVVTLMDLAGHEKYLKTT